MIKANFVFPSLQCINTCENETKYCFQCLRDRPITSSQRNAEYR